MGCDIHIVLERKHNDIWIGLQGMGSLDVETLEVNTWGEPKPPKGWKPSYITHKLRERDYDFFWAIAGVRGPREDEHGNELPHEEERGIPEDVSQLGQLLFDSWGFDGHSHSWLTLDELRPILHRCKEPENIATAVATKLEGGEHKDILSRWVIDLDGDLDPDPADYRIVFCFDN